MHHLDKDDVQNDRKSALYDRFGATILAYLCQMVSNRQDAEDLLLEVFMAAFNKEWRGHDHDGRDEKYPSNRSARWTLAVPAYPR